MTSTLLLPMTRKRKLAWHHRKRQQELAGLEAHYLETKVLLSFVGNRLPLGKKTVRMTSDLAVISMSKMALVSCLVKLVGNGQGQEFRMF